MPRLLDVNDIILPSGQAISKSDPNIEEYKRQQAPLIRNGYITPKVNMPKKKKFIPTKAFGFANSEQINKFKKDGAEEVLRKPIRSEFTSKESYNEALRKYNKYGNWASNE